jgi:serine/threonine protein kinase
MDHDFAGVNKQRHSFNLPEIKCILKQIIEGVQYLHANNIIHRDLKIANILFNNKGEVKLADFGLARLMASNANASYTNRVVTLWYRAPELLLGARKYTSQVNFVIQPSDRYVVNWMHFC